VICKLTLFLLIDAFQNCVFRMLGHGVCMRLFGFLFP